MEYEIIKSYFNVKHVSGKSCMAICPCHDDKKASLSISYDQGGRKTLLYCHAGCSTNDILDRVGLKMGDLFDEKKEGGGNGRNIEAVYKYLDYDGRLLFEKVRFKPKSFSQRRYMDGKVLWGLDAGRYYETYNGSNEFSKKERSGVICYDFPGIKPVLYNLPGIIEGVSNGETIYIVEGEKDADNLIKLGMIATTTFDGASKSRDCQKWRKEYSDVFKGAHVVLIPDNDEPGRCHMANIANELQSIAASIKFVELPVPNKEDVSWYLEEGHTKDELLEIIKNTPPMEMKSQPTNVSLMSQTLSDVGNAERIIALCGSIIRYDCIRDKFFIWNGKYWEMDSSNSIFTLAKTMLKKLMAEADSLTGGEDTTLQELKKMYKTFAVRSENDSRIRAMVNQLKSQREIMLNNSDADIYLLNLKNGTMDLRTGCLKEHSRDDYITRIAEIDWDGNAECPRWLEFLHKVFSGDKEMLDFVQRSAGYSLTGSQREQCFYMLYGSGANGKTTFLNTIKMISGDYSDILKPSSLMSRLFEDGARGDLAKLSGKRFVSSSELNEGQYFDESLLKAMTGGETIPVRFLYGEEFNLKPIFKIWMSTNDRPKIRGTDLGIWRRVRLIPFLYTFRDDERDKDFFEKNILPELPGILKWAVEGCLKWMNEGVIIPQKSLAEVEDYREEMDIVQRFLDENCITGEPYNVKVGMLYERFSAWCARTGEKSISCVKFSKKMKEKGFEQYKDKNSRYWDNIAFYTIR